MHRLDLIQDMKKASQIMQEKVFLVVMTSSMTSQGDLKVAPLYSLINEKLTFSVITEKRTTISSLNLVSIGIISLWIEFWQVRNRQIALSFELLAVNHLSFRPRIPVVWLQRQSEIDRIITKPGVLWTLNIVTLITDRDLQCKSQGWSQLQRCGKKG